VFIGVHMAISAHGSNIKVERNSLSTTVCILVAKVNSTMFIYHLIIRYLRWTFFVNWNAQGTNVHNSSNFNRANSFYFNNILNALLTTIWL
jgi:hypothetical protein